MSSRLALRAEREEAVPHVTFIHGISNKPLSDVVLASWRRALARDDGIDLGAEGITSSMVYWADVMYAEPKPETDFHESAEDGVADTNAEDVDLAFREEASPEEQEWLDSFVSKYNLDADISDEDEPSEEEAAAQFERIPLPGWMKKRIMSAYLRDVHHYLWNMTFSPRQGKEFEVQTEIRSRVQDALRSGAESGPPHVFVAHSMGTVMAYDNLMRVPDCPPVDGLVTVGSPLGLDEIQDRLQPEWTRDDGYPDKVGRWVNVYDHLDPVAGIDPKFANDYKRSGDLEVIDINEQSWGKWRHSVLKYLAGAKMRQELGSMLGL